MEITTPSGMRLQVRGMKGREAQAFADPSLQRSGGAMDMMLKACVEKVLDPGPYAPQYFRDGMPEWGKILMGDRFATLIDIRVESWGPDYEFDMQCESDACKEKYGWELRLVDLPRRVLPPDSAAKIAAGDNTFTTGLPGGYTLMFKLATGEDEQRLQKIKRANRGQLGIIDALIVRTLSVINPAGEDMKADAWLRNYLGDLDMPAIRDVLDDLQRPDCGVETEIETECSWCGWRQEVQLPFGATFFYPKKKKAPTASGSPTPGGGAGPDATASA